ncbi:MAG: phage tail protein [Thalassospira sp.]|uniref:phage tail protein n=1 Tax=Thalassospira sp. TaxID=1912094 RepID=UPI003A8A659A
MQGNNAVECEILNVIQGAGIWPDCDDKTQLFQAIEILIAGGGSGGGVIAGSEIGAVSAFAMPTPPEGWLVCDGAAISRTDYADLFAAIGTVWGAGDEISTFNLPDLRGEFVRGFDAGRGVDVDRVFGSCQLDQMQGHIHSFNVAANFPNTGFSVQGLRDGDAVQETTVDNVGVAKTDGVNGIPRVGQETRPRNIAMTYAIKAFYPTANVGQ